MLSTGREERRRADAVAAASRERLDRDAATSSAFLLARVDALRAQVDALEGQRSALRTEIERMTGTVVGIASRPLDLRLRGVLERLGRRSRSLRAP
jgi:hypothetical protein